MFVGNPEEKGDASLVNALKERVGKADWTEDLSIGTVDHAGTDEYKDKKIGTDNVLALRDITLRFGLYFVRLFRPA